MLSGRRDVSDELFNRGNIIEVSLSRLSRPPRPSLSSKLPKPLIVPSGLEFLDHRARHGEFDEIHDRQRCFRRIDLVLLRAFQRISRREQLAAVLVRQDRGLVSPDSLRVGDDLLLVHPHSGRKPASLPPTRGDRDSRASATPPGRPIARDQAWAPSPWPPLAIRSISAGRSASGSGRDRHDDVRCTSPNGTRSAACGAGSASARRRAAAFSCDARERSGYP